MTGKERLKSEATDLVGATFKVGFSAGFKLSQIGVFKLSAEIDLGSLESTQDQNGLKSEDTAALCIKIDVMGFGEIKLGGEKAAPAVDSDKFMDHVINVHKNGTSEKVTDASINIKGPLTCEAEDNNDIKLGVGGQLGLGGSIWLNITEVKDLGKFAWDLFWEGK